MADLKTLLKDKQGILIIILMTFTNEINNNHRKNRIFLPSNKRYTANFDGN